MEPLVTICIPTYNSGQTIRATLVSLLAQTYQNIEINIVDNKSTDNTIEMINTISDPRIKLHIQPEHFPIGEHNWNRCFKYMHGKYSAIFHSDDLYAADMIERQVNELEQNDDLCAVFTGAELIDEYSNLIKRIPLIDEFKNNKVLNQRDLLIATLYNGNTLFTPSVLVKSLVYRDVLRSFRYDMFKYSSDLDMWLRAAGYNIMVIDAPLLKYRVGTQQGSQTIHKLRTSEEAFFMTVDYYLQKYTDMPQDAINKYELRRMMDKLTCIKNGVKKLGRNIPQMVLWGIKKKLISR